jgi:hypothetical protein
MAKRHSQPLDSSSPIADWQRHYLQQCKIQLDHSISILENIVSSLEDAPRADELLRPMRLYSAGLYTAQQDMDGGWHYPPDSELATGKPQRPKHSQLTLLAQQLDLDGGRAENLPRPNAAPPNSAEMFVLQDTKAFAHQMRSVVQDMTSHYLSMEEAGLPPKEYVGIVEKSFPTIERTFDKVADVMHEIITPHEAHAQHSNYSESLADALNHFHAARHYAQLISHLRFSGNAVQKSQPVPLRTYQKAANIGIDAMERMQSTTDELKSIEEACSSHIHTSHTMAERFEALHGFTAQSQRYCYALANLSKTCMPPAHQAEQTYIQDLFNAASFWLRNATHQARGLIQDVRNTSRFAGELEVKDEQRLARATETLASTERLNRTLETLLTQFPGAERSR